MDQEDIDELQKQLQAEQEKSNSLQQELESAVKELSDSKVKYRKFLVGKYPPQSNKQ